MKNKKETAPTTEKERENFWLEIGPASALKAQSRKKSKINLWQRYDEGG